MSENSQELGNSRASNRRAIISKIEVLSLGERLFVETNYEEYASIMRRVTAVSRYPKAMKGRKYSCSLYRALGSDVTEVVYLVAVARVL